MAKKVAIDEDRCFLTMIDDEEISSLLLYVKMNVLLWFE